MEYQVVYDSGTNGNRVAKRIENVVNRMVQQGWRPMGGITISRVTPFTIEFAQAMVREVPKA